ncbi:hypothetical protein Ciccas_005076 [Cichlidogyrus casuarinus]|uniref:C2H2-type domain-containing protein n=1 Tax=Cichlidogyrus casuarinus TaxID=1844966 RepID=A0ABD2QAM0_9PLAT
MEETVDENAAVENSAAEKILYKCSICKRNFRSPSRLLSHCVRGHGISRISLHALAQTKESPKLKFKCYQCNRGFHCYSQLSIHRSTLHRSYPRLSACSDAAASSIHCTDQTSTTGDRCKRLKTRACYFCPQLFSSIHSFRSHLIHKHRDEFCQAIDQLKSQLVPPLKLPLSSPSEQHDVTSIHPPMCSTSKTKARRRPKPRLPCNSFGAIADRSNILATIKLNEGTDVNKAAEEAGVLAAKSGAPAPLDRKGRPCTFPCPACPRRFAFQCRLAAHLRCHTNIRPFTCADCGRAFTQKGYLARHAAVHKYERPFACKLCDRTYKHYGSLVNHKRTHNRGSISALAPTTSASMIMPTATNLLMSASSPVILNVKNQRKSANSSKLFALPPPQQQQHSTEAVAAMMSLQQQHMLQQQQMALELHQRATAAAVLSKTNHQQQQQQQRGQLIVATDGSLYITNPASLPIVSLAPATGNVTKIEEQCANGDASQQAPWTIPEASPMQQQPMHFVSTGAAESYLQMPNVNLLQSTTAEVHQDASNANVPAPMTLHLWPHSQGLFLGHCYSSFAAAAANNPQ